MSIFLQNHGDLPPTATPPAMVVTAAVPAARTVLNHIEEVRYRAGKLVKNGEKAKALAFLNRATAKIISNVNYKGLKADDFPFYIHSLLSLADNFIEAGDKTKARAIFWRVVKLLNAPEGKAIGRKIPEQMRGAVINQMKELRKKIVAMPAKPSATPTKSPARRAKSSARRAKSPARRAKSPARRAKSSARRAKSSGAYSNPPAFAMPPATRAKPSGAYSNPSAFAMPPATRAEPSGAYSNPPAFAMPTATRAKPSGAYSNPSAFATMPSATPSPWINFEHIRELQNQAQTLINEKNEAKALKLLNQALAELESEEGRAALQALTFGVRIGQYQRLVDLFTGAGDKKTALKLLNQVLTELESEGGRAELQNLGPIDRVYLYQRLANLFIRTDDKAKAQGFFGKAADLLVNKDSYEKLKEDDLEAYISDLLNLANQLTMFNSVKRFTGVDDNGKARELLDKAADLLVNKDSCEKLGAEGLGIYIERLLNLAKLCIGKTDKKTIQKLFDKAVGLLSERGYEKLEAHALWEYIGKLLDLAGQCIVKADKDMARKVLDRAADLLMSGKSYEKLKTDSLERYITNLLGLVSQYIDASDKDMAEKVFGQLQTVLNKSGDENKWGQGRWGGGPHRLETLRKAIDAMPVWQSLDHIGKLRDQALVLIVKGNKDEALKLLNQALAELETRKGHIELQRLPFVDHAFQYQRLGDVFIEADDKAKARELFGKAADQLLSKESYDNLKAGELVVYIDKLFHSAEQLIKVGDKDMAKKVSTQLQTVLNKSGDENKWGQGRWGYPKG